jgi:hypothetical protein
VPEGVFMNCRLSQLGVAMAMCASLATGCSSNNKTANVSVADRQVTLMPGLIPTEIDASEREFVSEVEPGELAWLASRNDSHVPADARIPEIADPGSYFIQTRDFQRTNNGRPWNHWSSRTWIEQRGSNR